MDTNRSSSPAGLEHEAELRTLAGKTGRPDAWERFVAMARHLFQLPPDTVDKARHADEKKEPPAK